MTADVGLGYAGHEVTRNTKVTDLDLPLSVDQDVCRFDVAVNDVVIILERLQSLHSGESDLGQHALGHNSGVDLVD